MNERVVIDQRSSCRDRHVTHITNLTPLNQRTNSYIKAASVAHLGRLFFTGQYLNQRTHTVNRVFIGQRATSVTQLEYCWFAGDDSAAMLVVKRKSISLLWELREKKLHCIERQHGCLVKWLQTKHKYTNSFTRATQNVQIVHTFSEIGFFAPR